MITDKEKKEIIEKLEIENLKKETQDKIIIELEENIGRNISLMILNILTEEDKKELEKIIEKENNGEVIDFLKSKNQLLDSFIKAVAVSTVKEFKELKEKNIRK